MSTQQREQENIKWVAVQKKAFTHWINRQLAQRDESIEELQADLANGVHLITLVEVLTQVKLEKKWSKKPVMKAHKITNCFLALELLKEQGVGHLTVSAENLVNVDVRDLPLILGFCWQLLRKYQGVSGSKNSSYEQSLLEWLRQVTASYQDINLDDGFKSKSFQDGKVWLALINEYRSGVIDYPSFSSENKEHNCTTAFRISEEQLNIPSLIDPVEMSEGKTSDKNIVLYLSLWFNAFKELNSGISKDDLAKRIAELEEKIRILTAENEELRRRRAELFASQNNLTEKLALLSSEEETLFSARDEIMTQLKELQDKYDLEKLTNEESIMILKEQIALSSENAEDQQVQLQRKIEEIEQDRDRLMEELRKLKEGMMKENADIAEKNSQLKKRLEQEKKDREALEQHLSKIQEEQGAAVIDLHKKLAKHVRDMHTWKDFLEQDKEYDSVDLHITMAEDLREEAFATKVDIVGDAFDEESTLLARLFNERTGKAVPSTTETPTGDANLSPRKRKEKK